jgi:signal transduction histidine kinase
MFTTLRSKILAGFAAIVAINVVFGLWTIYQFSQVGETMTQATSTNYELTSKIVELVAIVDRQFQLEQQITAGGDYLQLTSQFEQYSADFKVRLSAIPESSFVPGREELLQVTHMGYERFLDRSQTFRLHLMANRDAARDYLYSDVQPAAAAVKESCYNLFYQNRVEIRAMRDDLSQELQNALIVVGAATLLATLLGAVGGFFYSRWAIRPIQRLTQAVQNLTGGRLGERILITTADELGDLSFEFNRMIERLRRYEAMNIEQLLLEKRKVETIVQSIATPIVVVNAAMETMLINNAALSLFRLPFQVSYEGRDIRKVLRDEGVVETLRRSLAGEETEGTPSIYMIREEGAERFFAVTVLPLETTSAVNGVVAVFSDITHFKELDRLKSEFLAKVSHEFRTPLTSIIMSIDILREGLLGEINEAQRDLLASSKDDCKRLSKLIADLLELSRLEGTLDHRTFAQIDVAMLVDAVLKPHRLPASEKGVDLSVVVSPGVPAIWGDPEELRWLLNNLVSNAVRHTDRGGLVEIAIVVEARDLVLTVRDTGHGIPLDSLGKIFQKFHQVGDAAISTPGSVGLGLAIAKDVVEHYGGRISVVSELHKGSCFTVKIPLERLEAPRDQSALAAGDLTSSSDPDVP